MTEEIFGPVLTVYVYLDDAYEDTLRLCDTSTPYGLTGAIFAQDRRAIAQAESILRYAAGQLLHQRQTDRGHRGAAAVRRRAAFRDERQGRVLAQLTRWLSPRTIKETLVPARDWRRPYLGK